MLTLVTPPSVEPVTIAEAKKHARVFISADDAYIGELITAARDKFEKETPAGLYFAEQTWEWSEVSAAASVSLSPRPVIEVVSVVDGDEQTVDAGDYSLSVDRFGFGTITFSTVPIGPLTIQFAVGYPRAETVIPFPDWADEADYEENDIVTNGAATYTALSDHTAAPETEPGVGIDWETVWVPTEEPEPEIEYGDSTAPLLAKLAIKSLVAHWYNNREAYIASANGDIRSVPAMYLSILTNYR